MYTQNHHKNFQSTQNSAFTRYFPNKYFKLLFSFYNHLCGFFFFKFQWIFDEIMLLLAAPSDQKIKKIRIPPFFVIACYHLNLGLLENVPSSRPNCIAQSVCTRPLLLAPTLYHLSFFGSILFPKIRSLKGALPPSFFLLALQRASRLCSPNQHNQ